jgi:hypothetical protein
MEKSSYDGWEIAAGFAAAETTGILLNKCFPERVQGYGLGFITTSIAVGMGSAFLLHKARTKQSHVERLRSEQTVQEETQQAYQSLYDASTRFL